VLKFIFDGIQEFMAKINKQFQQNYGRRLLHMKLRPIWNGNVLSGPYGFDGLLLGRVIIWEKAFAAVYLCNLDSMTRHRSLCLEVSVTERYPSVSGPESPGQPIMLRNLSNDMRD
jgi:hypothetical protein